MLHDVDYQITHQLDLNKKENWTLANAEQIADILGFSYSKNFLDELEQYINEVVQDATLTAFLSIMATRRFKDKNIPGTSRNRKH
jgi:hypothetical protein